MSKNGLKIFFKFLRGFPPPEWQPYWIYLVTFPAIIFSIITCSISIKNHIQLEKSTLQVVTELDFWFLIYFVFKEFFYSTDIFEPKIMCDN